MAALAAPPDTRPNARPDACPNARPNLRPDAAPGGPAAPPDSCALRHPVFTRFGEVAFRSTADGVPAMMFPMGGSTAAVPLLSLQQEFRITPDSSDGRVLGQVVRALDFVAEVRPGDAFPLEVLGGGASWQPGAQHQRVAEERLRLQLAGAFNPAAGPAWAAMDAQAVLRATAEAGLDHRIQGALAAAAAALGLDSPEAAAHRLAAAAHEMGYVEALRDRLLRRVAAMLARLDALAAMMGHNPAGAELLSRVRRLAGIGHDKMRARFAELEASSTEVIPVLRDLEGWRPAIRLHRDWLYSSLRAWEGVLTAWEGGAAHWSPDTWTLLRRTYRFLAPRFMPVQEWHLMTRAQRAEDAPRVPMVW